MSVKSMMESMMKSMMRTRRIPHKIKNVMQHCPDCVTRMSLETFSKNGK